MKIGEVQIVDFCAIHKAQFRLDEQGLVLLQGDNQDDSSADSNGAGKSSLMDAVRWGLWGTTAREVSGDAVIRRDAKGASVYIEVIDEDDRSWFVLRTRKKGKETLTLTVADAAGVMGDKTLGTVKLTQAAIAVLLGTSEEVFNAAVYVGQEQMPDLPKMTDKALKVMVEEAAGITVLEACYAVAKKRVTAAELLVTKSLAEESRQFSMIEQMEESMERERRHAARFEDGKAERATAIRDKISANGKMSEDVEKLIADSGMLAGGIALVKLRIATINNQLADLDSEKDQELMLACKVSIASVAKTRYATSITHMVADLKKAKLVASSVSERVGTACVGCGTEITEDHLCAAQASADENLLTLSSTLRAEHPKYKDATAALETAEEALAAHTAAMHDPSALYAEHAELTKTLDTYTRRNDELSEIQRISWKLADDLVSVTAELNPHSAEIDKIRHVHTVAGIKHAALLMAGVLLDDDVANEIAAASVFAPAGVRAHILDDVTPYLNDRTSEYLSVLSDGNITAVWNTLSTTAKGELRERFAIDVEHTAGGESFAAISGGQKRKVRIACALALQDLVASRATKPFGLWVADEIDTALDPAGLERLMMVLQEKAKERGTVIIISHSNLRDWIPNVWTMTLKDKKSELNCEDE